MLHVLRLPMHMVTDEGTRSPVANHTQALPRLLLSAAHAGI